MKYLVEKEIGILLTIPRTDPQEDEETGPDFAYVLLLHPDLGPADALNDDSHDDSRRDLPL
jgi:hypothetical protein